MNREDIIRMAREAGFDYSGAELSWESVICTEELERFANLVASAAVPETSAEYRKGWHDAKNNGREICKECHLKDVVYDLLGDLKVANLKLSVRAQRTWVGLTDEELSDCMDMSIQKTCRAIEAKLKEKNNA